MQKKKTCSMPLPIQSDPFEMVKSPRFATGIFRQIVQILPGVFEGIQELGWELVWFRAGLLEYVDSQRNETVSNGARQ